MKKIVHIFLLSIFLLSNTYANSAFKASFLDEKNKQVDMIGNKDKKQKEDKKKVETIEHEAIIKEFNSSSDNTERILSKKMNCLKDNNGIENCPENLIQCNQIIQKDKGNSSLVKKTVYKNKSLKNNNYVCPENYIELDYHNLKEGLCKKDYSFYKYDCSLPKNEYNLNWKGPLLDTGEDCMGECGPNGCVCNKKTPPENNCMIENFGCPFDIEQKCSLSVSNNSEMPKAFDGIIYSDTISSKIEKTVPLKKICNKGFKLDRDNNCSTDTIKNCPLDSKLDKNGYCLYPNTNEIVLPLLTCPMESFYNELTNTCISSFSCENGAVKDNYGCEKNYSYYSYSCEKGYSLKEKGKDCLGTCGPNGCICNSETPKNNCFKKYSFDEQEINYKQERQLNIIKPIGTFNKDLYNKFFGFDSSGFEEINLIETDIEEPNKLCFSNNNKTKECIMIDNCKFEGKIELNKISELKLLDKNTISTSDEKQTIKSTCDLIGNVGWNNRNSGITSIISENNKLLFFDSYKDKEIGVLEFVPIVNKTDIEEGFLLNNNIAFDMINAGYTNISFIDGYTYFISGNKISKSECKKQSLKFKMEQETKFDSKNLREKIYILSGNNFDYLNTDNANVKCILKKENDFSLSTYTKLEKKLSAEKGKKIYSCSPFSCVDNMCQKASCQDGYEGELHSASDFVAENECFDEICDANKPFALYCGKSGGCDTTNSNIFLEGDSCKQATCEKGTFDKNKNKCIETK